MEHIMPIAHVAETSLGLALVMSSATPLILLDEHLIVRAASSSFCAAFGLDPAKVVGASLPELGSGEWGGRQLRSLLKATVAGAAAISAYEMDLTREGQDVRRLVINAQLLDYAGTDARIALAILDVSEARQTEKLKDDAIR